MAALLLPPMASGAFASADTLPASAEALTPQSTPTAAAILARFKAVTGGAAWDSVRTLHTVSSLSTSGLAGTSDEWDDILTGRTASRVVLGPTTQATGYDGRISWEQDNGNTAHPLDSVADKQDANDAAYLTALAFWFPDRRAGTIAYAGPKTDTAATYDVLDVTPAGGHLLRMWFDRATGLLARVIDQRAEQTQTLTLSDYRPIPGAGVLEPYAARQSTGIAKYDATALTTSLQINAALPAHEFELPTTAVADFAFAGNADSVTVPFHYWNEHIYLPIKIDGHPYQAIFDTGGAYVIDNSLAKELSLKPQGALQTTGNGEASVDTGDVRVGTVQIGGLTIKRPLFMAMPLPIAIRATPIVGPELAQRFVTSIDYDRDTITFTRPDQFRAPSDSRAIVVPFQFNDQMPEVNGSVDGVPGVFTIDTGAGGSLDLNGPFVAAHHLDVKYKPKFTVIFGYGVGGPDRAGIVRVKTLALGGAIVHDRITGLRGGATGGGSDKILAGNVGNAVLHQFNLILDYQKQTITFVPNHHYGDPDQYTRSGIVADARSARVLVSDVIPGSPAAQAGIKPGDIVVSIDNHPVMLTDTADETMRDSFNRKPAGTRVLVTFQPQGHGKARTVTLVLRELV